MTIDKKYWNGTRWDGHKAFDTISHHHVCNYFPKDGEGFQSCEVLVIERRDGQFYIEDWWQDACSVMNQFEAIWDPYDPEGKEPVLFGNFEAAYLYAREIVKAVSGEDPGGLED